MQSRFPSHPENDTKPVLMFYWIALREYLTANGGILNQQVASKAKPVSALVCLYYDCFSQRDLKISASSPFQRLGIILKCYFRSYKMSKSEETI